MVKQTPRTLRRIAVLGCLAALVAAGSAHAIPALRVEGKFRIGGVAKVTGYGLKPGKLGAYMTQFAAPGGANCLGTISPPRRVGRTHVFRGRWPTRLSCWYQGSRVGSKSARAGGYIVTVCEFYKGTCRRRSTLVSFPVQMF